jgi:hypothetical protein
MWKVCLRVSTSHKLLVSRDLSLALDSLLSIEMFILEEMRGETHSPLGGKGERGGRGGGKGQGSPRSDTAHGHRGRPDSLFSFRAQEAGMIHDHSSAPTRLLDRRKLIDHLRRRRPRARFIVMVRKAASFGRVRWIS